MFGFQVLLYTAILVPKHLILSEFSLKETIYIKAQCVVRDDNADEIVADYRVIKSVRYH